MNNFTEQEIRSDFEKYMHPVWKVVGRYPAGNEDAKTFSSDNYHLLTALYFRILVSHGFYPTVNERLDYARFVTSCMIQPGLMCRFPGRVTDISQDEIYGAVSVFTSVASQIEKYGRSTFYSYNLVNPGKFTLNTFLGRYPCFTSYLKTASGNFPWFWDLYWWVGFVCSALTSHGESSGKNLSYLQIPIMKRSLVGRSAIWIWKKIMEYRYTGGMTDVMRTWASDHPMSKYCQGSFE